MDATVNDFLNEINEILPPAPAKKTTNDSHEWQECFDDDSGFPYYWNVNTNKVTWEMPKEYKQWLEAGKIETNTKKLFIPENCTPKVNKVVKTVSPPPLKDKPQGKVMKVRRGSNSDSEDEKIVLISSYGGDTDSETEDEETERTIEVVEVKKEPIKEVNSNFGGLSLLAGYSDSSDDEEDISEEAETPTPELKIAHSTLFPVPQTIDINQFTESIPEKEEIAEELDTKAFQRKRRIGVQLINVPRKLRIDNDRAPEIEDSIKSKLSYIKSAGISFVKSDALPATFTKCNGDSDLARSIDDEQSILKEKLTFLSEAKEPVSPVQIMLLQLDTLYAALKCGSLESNYLTKWINEMTEELVKLEAESTPKGWLLEWDRLQKRYYYRNEATDECQWEYPESNDDSMDICTTPPPSGASPIVEEAPPKTPSPPPPPLISEVLSHKEKIPQPQSIFIEQPLPPGVDPVETKPKNDLNIALDSFYSDIAAIENKSSPADANIDQPDVHRINGNNLELLEVTKKKKKVKLAAGIAMKKKGVSKMVEKWKNMQKELV